MSSQSWVGAAAGAAMLLVLLVLLVWLRTRRQVIRRVGAVVARLDERPAGVDGGGGNLESALSRLERTTDRANTRLADATTEYDRLVAALEALDDGVVVVNETGRVVLRNRVAAEFVDARHGDALAEAAVREMLAQALGGIEARREIQLFGPPRRSLVIQALPLADAGGAVGAAAFVSDISTLRRVDSMRRDFVANVSHELKTPIGALVALSETLDVDDDPSVMRRLAERVRREAERLARIVDDLLDLSLIEAQEAPERAPVPAADLMGEAVDRIREAAAARSACLDVADIPGDAVVVCDRSQIVSALFNLLDNAVKYLNEADHGGGTVWTDVTVAGDTVVFSVRDDGVGIPDRDRDRIFERFYRVDRARSRASGGTGLGLSIVRHVAQAHGGSVTVESEEGTGSTFTLRLPRTGLGTVPSTASADEVPAG